MYINIAYFAKSRVPGSNKVPTSEAETTNAPKGFTVIRTTDRCKPSKRQARNIESELVKMDEASVGPGTKSQKNNETWSLRLLHAHEDLLTVLNQELQSFILLLHISHLARQTLRSHNSRREHDGNVHASH